MLGIASRIAQRMNLQYESNNSKYPILEAEMRRRLWWSFVLFDARISELSHYRSTTLSPTWDCKIPLNVNDFDLCLEMKEPPAVQGKITEALFAQLRCEIGEFIRHSSFHLDFTNPSLKPVAKALPGGGNLDALEDIIEKEYLEHCNSQIPLHFMTIWLMRCTLSKHRLLEYYSRCSFEPRTERSTDTPMLYAFRVLECDTKIMSSPLTKGYTWFLHSHFPLPAYIHIVQELIKTPTRPEAQQGWDVMSDNFEARFRGSNFVGKTVFKPFAKIILQAWEALEKGFEASESSAQGPLVPPRIVSNLKRRMAEITQDELTTSMEQQFNEFSNSDVTDLLMSVPMGFGNPNPLYGMAGPDSYAGIDPAPLPNPSHPGQTPTISRADMHQMTWASMSWAFHERCGW